MESEKSMEQRVSQLETDVKVVQASYVPKDVVNELRIHIDRRFAEADAKMEAKFSVVYIELEKTNAKIELLRKELRAEIAEFKALFFKALVLNNIAVFGLLAAYLNFFR